MKHNYTDDEIDLLYKKNQSQFIPGNDIWRNIEDSIKVKERSKNFIFIDTCTGFYKNCLSAFPGESVLLLRVAVLFFALSGFIFAGIGYMSFKSGLNSEHQYKSAMKDIKEAEKLYKKAKASLLLLAKEGKGDTVAINSV